MKTKIAGLAPRISDPVHLVEGLRRYISLTFLVDAGAGEPPLLEALLYHSHVFPINLLLYFSISVPLSLSFSFISFYALSLSLSLSLVLLF